MSTWHHLFTRQIIFLFLFVVLLSCDRKPARMLIYTPPTAAVSSKARTQLLDYCQQKGIESDTSSSIKYITEDSLAHYHSLALIGISPDEFSYREQNDLERFIQAGGGLVIVNAAKDTVLNWQWFQELTSRRVESGSNTWNSRYDGGRVYFAQLKDDGTDTDIVQDAVDYSISSSPDFSGATTP